MLLDLRSLVELPEITGTAAIAAPVAALSLAGEETFTATIALAAPAAALAIAALETFTGTAAVTAPSASLAGAGAETFTGTATLTAPAAALAIAALETFVGTSHVAAPPAAMALDGTATDAASPPPTPGDTTQGAAGGIWMPRWIVELPPTAIPAVRGRVAVTAPAARVAIVGTVIESDDWLLGLEDDIDEHLLALV